MKKFLSIILFSMFALISCGNSQKIIVSTSDAPAAIGPYSQAVIENGIVYCSGQIALDPVSGLLVGKNIKEQTTQIFNNISAILKAANSSLENVIKSTVYLTDINSFNDMNEIYGTYFKEGGYPARSAVEVSALPKGALVEIEVTAFTF